MTASEVKIVKSKPIVLKPLPHAKVDIINLIDVLITLIAFFMLTTTFISQQSRLGVDLPHSKQAAAETVSSKLMLEVRQDESIWVNGNRVALDQLEEVFRQTASQTVVVIRGDKKVSYQTMIGLLDLLKKYDLSRISFEVKKVED